MVRAAQKPGRRRALPTARADAYAPPGRASAPARGPRPQPQPGITWRLVAALWFVAVATGLAALVLDRTAVAVSEDSRRLGSVLLTCAFAFALAARTGGRARGSGALALALSLVAVTTEQPVLLAGAALSTAVLAAVLGVMSTKPAARFHRVAGEVAVATVVAGVGALAVAGYQAQVSVERTGYLALGLSLLAVLVLVHRLGAGIHGLGKRGAVMVLVGLLLLGVILAYTEALVHWGSSDVVEVTEDAGEAVRSVLGGVPLPIAVLLGFPALTWGIATRARRRQGWWVCAFGTAGLAEVAVGLLDAGVPLGETVLSLLYSAVLGLGLGYLVVRADLFLTGPRGRRARRLEEAAALRPEPGRLRPLL